MPVYPNLRCVFIHIPKTGGQSFCAMLSEAESSCLHDGTLELAHLTATQTNDRLRRFFKFAIVRDPLERLKSEYRFSQQGHYRPYLPNYDLSFPEFVESIAKIDRKSLSHADANHLYQQVDFLYEDENLLVDYVGRFERLGEVVGEVSDRLKRQLPILPHINKSECPLECDYKTEKLVRLMYRDDYKKLGY